MAKGRAVRIAGIIFGLSGEKDSVLDKRRRADEKQNPNLYAPASGGNARIVRLRTALFDVDTPDPDRPSRNQLEMVARQYKLAVEELKQAQRTVRESKFLSTALHSGEKKK